MTNREQPILMYDGSCGFCNASIDFILKHEKDQELQFLWLESDMGQELVKSLGVPKDVDSLIYIQGLEHFTYSEAVFYAMKHLKKPWSWLRVFRWLPRGLSNVVYRIIARHRKKIMGSTHCELPNPEIKLRFLDMVKD